MLPDYQMMTLGKLMELLVEKSQALSFMRQQNESGIRYEDLKDQVRQIQAAIESKKVISIYHRNGRTPDLSE